jgi:hypothetical protein
MPVFWLLMLTRQDLSLLGRNLVQLEEPVVWMARFGG